MNHEQLTMDLFSTNTSLTTDEPASYEPLDIQLAQLMQSQNGESNQTLYDTTLAMSKNTREGQIALACSAKTQTELLKTQLLATADDVDNYKPLIMDNGYCYLRRYWQYQQNLANQIISRMGISQDDSDNDWLSERLDHYFGNDTAKTDWQKVATKTALEQNFLVLSGGPGTGKTTTITRILALLIEQHCKHLKHTPPLSEGFRILLAAPTGKAAIRMVDSIRGSQQSALQTLNLSENVLAQIPTQASTIHKLLGYQHGKIGFKHNKNNPLNADVVLVDEASMIDIALMSKLVEAVPADAKLILIGDKDQLSSVETGSVFADICEGLNKSKHLVTLEKNWRFTDDSGIGQLAKAANTGDSTKMLKVLKDKSKTECALVSPSKLNQQAMPSDFIEPWSNYFKTLENHQANLSEIFSAFNQYRILCALRQGHNGSNGITNRIEAALEKRKLIKQGQSKNKNWYHGRPVMIIQNSYSKGLFNGDTGITLVRNGETKVYFPDAEQGTFKSIAPVRLPAHETTWAMTIHKSQGSEFEQVTLLLPHEVMPLLTRQLIYTGVTRAKIQLKIVSDEDVLVHGVKENTVRATQIAGCLIND